MKPKILAFGEVLWDKYETESFIGGGALNFIAHCARCGAEGYLYTGVGRDEWGSRAAEELSRFGICRDFVKTTDKSTGLTLVTLHGDGMPRYNVLSDTAYDNIPFSDEDGAAVRGAGFHMLYFGTLIQRSPVSRVSLRRMVEACPFTEILCDVNLRKDCYDEDSARFCLAHATILKVGDEEEPTLRQMGLYTAAAEEPLAIAEGICARYPQVKYILYTMGGKGSFVYSALEKRGFFQPAKCTPVLSTVGAGDSYAAAWAVSYLSGLSVEKAAENAAALSGFVVSNTAAVPEYQREDLFRY